jgi:hypothetical protein
MNREGVMVGVVMDGRRMVPNPVPVTNGVEASAMAVGAHAMITACVAMRNVHVSVQTTSGGTQKSQKSGKGEVYHFVAVWNRGRCDAVDIG